jgi:hypothetical protein
MDLAHRAPASVAPAAVELAELGIAIAIGVVLEVLEVQQLQGDAGRWVGGVGGPYTRASRTSSVRISTWAQSSPAARARNTVVPTVPLLILRLSATARWLCPRPHFCRRISRIWRMESRSVAIGPFLGRMTPSTVQRRYTPAILPREDALPGTGRGVITMVRSS